jgi:hypothetical protein
MQIAARLQGLAPNMHTRRHLTAVKQDQYSNLHLSYATSESLPQESHNLKVLCGRKMKLLTASEADHASCST